MASSGEAVLGDLAPPRAAARPLGPAEGETILWQGRAQGGARRAFEFAALFLLLTLLSWLAIELILPHFRGSDFAGNPDAGALPLILAMMAGMVAIIALPVWLRSSARGRATYMLTNRRALVWLGDRVIAEAVLFGSTVTRTPTRTGATLAFTGALQWLDWRLKDEGDDRLRFEDLPDADDVAAIAERHGARLAP